MPQQPGLPGLPDLGALSGGALSATPMPIGDGLLGLTSSKTTSAAELRVLRGVLPASHMQLLEKQAAMLDQIMGLLMQLLMKLMRGQAVPGLSPGGGSGPVSGVPGVSDGGGKSGPSLETSGGGQPAVMRQGKRIGANIASAFDRMVEAAKRDGVELRISSGYRTHEEQQRLWNANPNPTMVARPGTSNHEKGNAIDFANTSGAYDWLKKNATRFGFHNYPPEPWHYSTDGH